MSNSSLSRRAFLATAAATPLAYANGALPTRKLGKTGAEVTFLALGCGSRLLSYKDESKGVETVQLALDSGIGYLDTAQNYGSGKSETWVGKAIKGKRDGIFLATKTGARTADDVFKRADESLKRLGTDHVDLLHLHSLGGPDDLDIVEKEKVMEALYKLRDQKMARFIGITSHTDPSTLAEALRRYDVDCTQMALNAALQGMRNGKGKMVINPAMSTSFEEVALPVARQKGLGILAMKVFGQDDIIGEDSTPDRLLQYSLSLPVAACVVGCPKHEQLHANLSTGRSFKPLKQKEMQEFSRRTSARYKMALDRKFESHVDA